MLSRPDPPTPGGAPQATGAPDGATPRRVGRARRWAAVLTWILLGGAIAALWALLLLGDSPVVNG